MCRRTGWRRFTLTHVYKVVKKKIIFLVYLLQPFFITFTLTMPKRNTTCLERLTKELEEAKREIKRLRMEHEQKHVFYSTVNHLKVEVTMNTSTGHLDCAVTQPIKALEIQNSNALFKGGDVRLINKVNPKIIEHFFINVNFSLKE